MNCTPKTLFLWIAALSGLALQACSNPSPSDAEVLRTVIVAPVSAASVRPSVTVPGVLRAAERTQLSFEVSGRIQSISVELGAQFQQGDILARLVGDVQRASLATLKAEHVRAGALLTEAETTFERQLDLFELGHISSARLDQARAARDSAEAVRAAAKAQVTRAVTQLAQTVLTAPYDGVITGRFFEPGETVGTRMPILNAVSRAQTLEVVLNLPAIYRREISADQSLQVRIAGTRDAASASIQDIGTEANQAGLFPLVATLDQPLESALPGQTVEAQFLASDQPDALSIPLSAFVRGPDNVAHTFVFDPGNKTVRKTAVVLGGFSTNHAAVLSGLSAGQLIVLRGVDLLHDGQSVSADVDGPRRYLR